jgi:hypothetical protein
MKRFIGALVALLVLTVAVPAVASAAVVQTTPQQNPGFAGTNTFYIYSDGTTSTWKSLTIRADNGGQYNLGFSWSPSSTFVQIRWSDTSTIAPGEILDTWSDLQLRVRRETRGPGIYDTNLRLANAGGDNGADVTNSPYLLPVRMVVEPRNECTDRLDNDGDGKMDWRPAFHGVSVDTDCTDMNDTTEGGTAPVPAAPSNLSASATSDTQINLGWSDNSSNETGFELQRDLTASFTSPTTVTKGAGVTSHSDTSLTPSTQYFYRVRATGSGGNSTYSSVVSATTQAAPPGGTMPARWDPAASTTWLWHISTRRTALNDVGIAAYDLDWQLQTAGDIATVHANGKKAICYFNAGAYQPGQPDESQWTAAMKGNPVEGWPGEFWTDTRRSDVRAIMAARIQACKDKGFDAIEPDNLDGYSNNPGFPMTAADARDYVQFLSLKAHEAGLAIFLKNMTDDGNAGTLGPWVDGVINEQCHQFSECGVYTTPYNYIANGKPVLQTEYTGTQSTWTSGPQCQAANAAGRMAARAGNDFDLDGDPWIRCWPSSTPVDLGGTTTSHPS